MPNPWWEDTHEVLENGCWKYTGHIMDNGYALKSFEGRRHTAHKAYYLKYVGSVEDGLVVDHKCRNRSCVNPSHLQAITQSENLLRAIRPERTHCPQGHEYDQDNTYMSKGKYKVCRTCRNDSAKELRRMASA